MRAVPVYNPVLSGGDALVRSTERIVEAKLMNPKIKVLVGILTALAMMLLTFALPRGGFMRESAIVQFPMTVGIWAIFVLLFVKLK